MKKYFLLAIIGVVLAFFQTSSAGDLRFGINFINALLTPLHTTKDPCPSIFANSKDLNYWCGITTVSVDTFKFLFDGKAPGIAKSNNYDYAPDEDWKKITTLTWGKTIYLDQTYMFISVLPFDGINHVFFGVGSSSDKTDRVTSPVTAYVPPAPYSNPVTTNPDSSTPKPTTVDQTTDYDVTVLRYLCQTPVNGYARAVGTIRNSSNRTLEFLRFNIEYFDGSSFVGQESGYVQADKLAPGSESTFDLTSKTPAFTRCELSFEDSSGKLKTKLP